MNSSETLDLIPFECDTTYNGFLGVLEYVGTVFYMVPGILMHLLIVRCVLITQKKRFSGSSFFLIFVTDSVAMWTTLTPISIICVMIMPFFGIWNVLISPRIFLTPVFGGFGPNYQKVVPWVCVSLFLFSVRSAANALPSNSDGRGRVGDERVEKIERAVADVLL
uniref:Serpentine receptor class gamma n=1 Tax=Caenorhabditis japonica TaxID=281687 RepID=A0A8R1EHR2_CAEJA